VVEVTAEQCDRCGSTNLEEYGVEKQVIEEIPLPPRIEVFQFNRHKYKCKDCERKFTAKDEECPQQKGKFGVNLLVYLINFAFHLNAFEITPKGIRDAILCVRDSCKTAYSANIEKVRIAAWNYMDETGFGFSVKYWLWTFRMPDDWRASFILYRANEQSQRAGYQEACAHAEDLRCF